MADELEKRGNELFVLEDYEEALECYSQAIALEPSKPSLYISRASAHSKLENWTDAVSDANKAIELEPSLPKAYLRKGIACFTLEEYETARTAFLAGASQDPVGNTFKSWIQKCDAKLKDDESAQHANDSSARSSEINGMHAGSDVSLEQNLTASRPEKDDAHTPTPTPTPTPMTVVSVSQQSVQPKFRHEWYQAQTHVVITIFAKGIKNDDVKIDFGEQMLSVIIQAHDGEPYILQLRLYGKVKASECSYKVLSTKIEVRLVKAELINWKGLEFDKRQDVQRHSGIIAVPQTRYPSSSKKASTDWDKFEAEVKKEEKDEKLEGDAALNKLFREIYQNADEDTRRAMNKSFVESSGTVLSTNWKEVGTKHVEGSAPKGMEMRKWEV
ncbi:hypothetical protein O6H91_23G035600 [Diphasiastrum complanatum]|uniref:Uncharacterized protein n=1 Tax=Diphasiastrum complanatum TaxID=34168 RepID=A0ACC2AAX8_DIPCM|nr:hypothetical protein O6H91_23G035600 [Diphasiastrum complanatum]